MKKKLLILGSADSIFLYHYVKSLKKINDIEVTIYSPNSNSNNYKELPCDNAIFEGGKLLGLENKRPICYIVPFLQALRFKKFIKNKSYDFIHIHRVLPLWTLLPNTLVKHCRYLYLSFWGGELNVEALIHSKWLYRKLLVKLIKKSDKIIGANDGIIKDFYPGCTDKLFYGEFGSSIIDLLCVSRYDIDECRKKYKIGDGSVSVMLGYSGKALHNHIKVFEEIQKNELFSRYKDKLHFILSMTRGGSESYINHIKKTLEEAEVNYTLIANTYQTDEEIAQLRLATDVLFQLSTFDYLSASVKECLCAGSVMISGDWLPYDILKTTGFKYYEVNDIEEGVKLFYTLLPDFENVKNECLSNFALCDNSYSWQACIKDWNKYYCEE